MLTSQGELLENRRLIIVSMLKNKRKSNYNSKKVRESLLIEAANSEVIVSKKNLKVFGDRIYETMTHYSYEEKKLDWGEDVGSEQIEW